jgi:hypothetical protein
MSALHAQAPPDEETARGASAGRIGDHEKVDAAIVRDAANDDKRFNTLTAQFALHHGHVVNKLASGKYLVTWRGVATIADDLDGLEALARRVGAA